MSGLVCRHHSEVSSWTSLSNREAPLTFLITRSNAEKERPWRNEPRRGVGKWKHTGVLLDGLGECSRCGGVFTPALPSVPRHLFNDRPAHRQKGPFLRSLDERHFAPVLFKEKDIITCFLFFFFLFPDRQVKVFSFGKCLLSRFQEINLSTPFLTTLWWNLARLTQAITFAINSDARLQTKIHGCRWL